MPDLKIREGICYRTRDGRKVGPMKRGCLNGSYAWQYDAPPGRGKYLDDNGRCCGSLDDPFDLIAEWVEPEPRPTPAKPDGFWNGLRPDQKEQALAYRGPEDHGSTPAKTKYRVGDEIEVRLKIEAVDGDTPMIGIKGVSFRYLQPSEIIRHIPAPRPIKVGCEVTDSECPDPHRRFRVKAIDGNWAWLLLEEEGSSDLRRTQHLKHLTRIEDASHD